MSMFVFAAARYATAIVFALLAMGASVMASDNQNLVGSSWRPVEIRGQPIPENTKQFIKFDENSVDAHGGCNRMGGSYEADKANIKFGPFRGTRMGCAPEIMARESAFANALEATRLFLLNDNSLTFKDAQGVTTMRLVKKAS